MVSPLHVLSQGPVVAALLRTIAVGTLQAVRSGRGSARAAELPGPEHRATLAPRPPALVRDFVRHLGGDPAAYGRTLPPHLFPQWTFPLAARTLDGIPYPLVRVLNGGCRFESKAPLPADEPLEVRARLEGIDDNGRRAVLHQRLVTGTRSAPDALVCDLFAIVPLARSQSAQGTGAAKPVEEKPFVPADARELARWELGSRAGLDFALLTGDFNPIHWARPYARAFGFPSTILHGFGTLARAVEALRVHILGADPSRLAFVDVRFTKPLVLPRRVGVYVDDAQGLYVADAAGTEPFLKGSFGTR